jgi:uncharacterized protein
MKRKRHHSPAQRNAQELREAALAEVRAIYAELAAHPIERQCTRRTECCHFKLTGRTPYLTMGEALLAARALRATGRTRLPQSADGAGGACPLLQRETGKCLVYEARPFGCRTHFCAVAGGPYARGEVLDLIRRLENVDASLGGDGSHALPEALASALREM